MYHDDFVRKTEDELKQMSHVDLFKYRCKEAIVQKMIPYRHTNNVGFESDACKVLMSLANQMTNSTVLMEIALMYGYGGDFSKIIYDEIDKALQSYCNVSIYNVYDYNEQNHIFEKDRSLEMYICFNRFEKASSFIREYGKEYEKIKASLEHHIF